MHFHGRKLRLVCNGPFAIGLSFQFTFQLQNPFCSIHKSVLLASVFHAQNSICFRCIRLKQKRILARILWTSICNLRELLDDVNGHRVSKSLSTANEESFISRFRSGESFDMSISQISNIDLLSEISKDVRYVAGEGCGRDFLIRSIP